MIKRAKTETEDSRTFRPESHLKRVNELKHILENHWGDDARTIKEAVIAKCEKFAR